MLSREDEVVPTGEGGPNLDAHDGGSQRPRSYDLSSLRNIGAPTVVRKSSATARNSQETAAAKNSQEERRKSAAALSGRSAEYSEDSVGESVESSEDDNDNRNENDDVDDEEEAGDRSPTRDHIPCETIFAINRHTARPFWQTIAAAAVATPVAHKKRESTTGDVQQQAAVRVKTEPVDDFEYRSAAGAGASVQASPPERPRHSPGASVLSPGGSPRPPPVQPPVAATQRTFYCVYCGLTSRWSRRDVKLHVMHVHIGLRTFSCGHCGFGNSRNRAVVRSHCSKNHPGRQLHIVDNEALFDAIDSVRDQDNLVTMAFVTPEGSPLLTLDELERHLSNKGIKFRIPANGRKTTEPRVQNLPGPEKVRETIRNNPDQAQNRPNDQQMQDMLLDSVNFSELSELSVSKEQMKELNCEWKCHQCDFRDLDLAEVESHIVREHLRLDLYSCPYCQKYYAESHAVLGHIEEDHEKCERRFVSTVDAKESYIRRNIECVSVDVQSRAVTPQLERVSSAQSISAEPLQEKSNEESSKPEKDTAGVPPQKPADREPEREDVGPAQSDAKEQSSSLSASVEMETEIGRVEISPVANNSTTEKMDQSSFGGSSVIYYQEECHVTDGVSPTISASSAVQEEHLQGTQLRSNEEVSMSVDSIPDFQLETGESLGDKQVESTTSDAQKINPVDYVSSSDLPTVNEGKGLLEDSSSQVSENTQPVPPDASDISASEGNVDSTRTTDSEQTHADAEEQESERDSAESAAITQHDVDATVPPAAASDAGTGERSGEVLESGWVEKVTAEVVPDFDSAKVPPDEDVKEPESSLSTPVERELDDGAKSNKVENPVPSSAEVYGTDSSPFDAQNSRPIVGNNASRMQQYRCVYCPDFSHSSVVHMRHHCMTRHPGKPINYQRTVLPCAQIVSTPVSSSATVHDVSAESSAADSVVKNLEPPSEPAPPPSNTSSQEEPSTGSVDDAGAGAAAAQQLNAEDRQQQSVGEVSPSSAITSRHVVDRVSSVSADSRREKSNGGSSEPAEATTPEKSGDEEGRGSERLESTQSEPLRTEEFAVLPAGKKPNEDGEDGADPTGEGPRKDRPGEDGDDDDEGLSSDSSSLSDSTSNSTAWRCEDCPFVATSESQLVVHRRSRQQYRCVYCPDFSHSSVVHMRHHCMTRHPGKPINYGHTVLPCAQIVSTPASSSSSPANVARVPAKSTAKSSADAGQVPAKSQSRETEAGDGSSRPDEHVTKATKQQTMTNIFKPEERGREQPVAVGNKAKKIRLSQVVALSRCQHL